MFLGMPFGTPDPLCCGPCDLRVAAVLALWVAARVESALGGLNLAVALKV